MEGDKFTLFRLRFYYVVIRSGFDHLTPQHNRAFDLAPKRTAITATRIIALEDFAGVRTNDMLDLLLRLVWVVPFVPFRHAVDSLVPVRTKLSHGQRIEPTHLRETVPFLVTSEKLLAAVTFSTTSHDLRERVLVVINEPLPQHTGALDILRCFFNWLRTIPNAAGKLIERLRLTDYFYRYCSRWIVFKVECAGYTQDASYLKHRRVYPQVIVDAHLAQPSRNRLPLLTSYIFG